MAIIQRGWRTNMNNKTITTADFYCGTILPNHPKPKPFGPQQSFGKRSKKFKDQSIRDRHK